MAIRQSRAFAAFRAALVMELAQSVTEELLPQFNAEAEDIRREHEEIKPRSEALADHKRRARIYDLQLKKQQFIDSLNLRLKMECKAKVEDEYGGKIVEVKKDDDEKTYFEAQFTDGSTARVPQGLWIDFKQFQRV